MAVAAVSGCIAVPAKGWPTYEGWPDESVMGLLVNGALPSPDGTQKQLQRRCDRAAILVLVLVY